MARTQTFITTITIFYWSKKEDVVKTFTFTREHKQQKQTKTIKVIKKRNELEKKFIAARLQKYEWLRNIGNFFWRLINKCKNLLVLHN